jgi:hypothetical protein
MAQTKDKHYWSQLRIALTAGSWGSPYPAKAFKGGPVSWTDLLRKFKKHCHGYADVSEIANQTQALALLVAGGPTERELDGVGYHHEDLFTLGTESVVADEHAVEAEVGYKILRGLEAENTNSDVRLDHSSLLPLTTSTTSVAETRSRLLCVCPQRSGSVSLLPQSSPRSCQRAEPPKPGGLASLKRVFPPTTFCFR